MRGHETPEKHPLTILKDFSTVSLWTLRFPSFKNLRFEDHIYLRYSLMMRDSFGKIFRVTVKVSKPSCDGHERLRQSVVQANIQRRDL
jgi:hypothetical protein